MDDYTALLARYGVSTPILDYAGAVKPEDETDPEYNDLLGKYNVDRAQYDAWLAEYKRRKALWNMYGPDFEGELLGMPSYTYGYQAPETDTPDTPNPDTTTPEVLPIITPGGGSDRGSGNQSSPIGDRNLTSTDLYGAPTTYGWSMDQAMQSVKDNPGRYAAGALMSPLGTLGQFGVAGLTADLPDAMPGSIMGMRSEGLTSEADHMQGYGMQAAIDAATESVNADRAMTSDPMDGFGYDSFGSDTHSGGISNGAGGDSTGTDDSGRGTNADGNDSWAKGGLVNLHQKYEGGGIVQGGQNLSPELQAFIEADARVNGIENPTTRFEGGQSYGLSPTPVQPSEAATLLELMSKYSQATPRTSDYAAEHQEARQAVSRETAAFNDMLKQAMDQKTEGPSRAEMYFKLAAAFAAPTKTGAFGESMGNAASVLAEHKKDTRAASATTAARRLELGMAGQKARMDAAKTDLADLRQLTAKEMDAAKAQAMELVKIQLQAGKPQSEAGKIAMDQGLQPGTPAYAKFVSEYVTDKIESGKLFKEALISISQQGANVRQSAENRKVAEASMLTPVEGKAIATEQTALDAKAMLARNLELAFQLNKKAMSGSGIARATGAVLGAVGYPSERLKAEEELTQNLTQASLDYASRLKPMSDADARLAQKLTGLQGSSPASRAAQIEALYRQAKAEIAQHEARINDVRSRKNRAKIEAPTIPEGAE